MDGYFGDHDSSAFGVEHKRALMEGEIGELLSQMTFPLRAFGRAAGLTTAARPVTVRASGGRKGRFL